MSNTSRAIQPFSLPIWLPLTLLAVTIALLFYRLLLGEVLFWGLPSLQFYPWREFAISELQAGRLPLWNPFNGAGAPLLANYQSALLYPPNTLSLLIPGPQLIGWLGMFHLLWAGVGMWLLTGELKLPTLARGVGALAYALNGAVVSRFGTPPMVDAAAWLPWLVLAAERVISRRALIDVVFLAVVTAMQLLAGHAQWTFYTLALTGGYVVYRLINPIALNPLPLLPRAKGSQKVDAAYGTFAGDKRDQSETTGSESPSPSGEGFRVRANNWLIPICLLIVGIGLGVGLAAIQLAPTAELQRQSQRSEGVNEDFALNFSYEWPSLITQFNPMFYGNPGDGSYLIPGAYFETASYIGILPILLALITLGHYILNRRRIGSSTAGQLIPFLGIVALVSFVFAFGRHSPIFVFLFRHVPTFNLFQAPSRWLLLAEFSLSLLAAIGASLWKFDPRTIARARLGFVAALGVTMLSIFLYVSAPDRPIVKGLIVLGVLLSASGIAFVTQPKTESARWRYWAVGVLVFVAADLLWANALSNPTVSPDFYQRRAEASDQRTFTPSKELNAAEFDQFLVFKDYRVAVQRQKDYRAAGFPNMNLLDRQPSFNTFEPLRPGGIERFTQLLDEHLAPNLFAAAAIPQTDTPNPPRAWIAPTVIISENPIRAMTDPAWQPMMTVFLEGDAPTLAGTDVGTAKINQETSLSLQISVNAPIRAALVLADTWYPGWSATIDGVPTPIYRANAAFRAVIVPAGQHTVTMQYAPDSLRLGAIISGVSVLILIGLLIVGIVRW